MTQVIVFPRGQLSELDKARMDAAGIIAVEADDPGSVVVAIPSAARATGDDLLLAALTGLDEGMSYKSQELFVRALAKRLHGRDAAREAAATEGTTDG